MQGCDAVLSTLNITRYSDFPWSSLRTPETFLSNTIQKVLAIAADLNLKRIIIISAWGDHETRQDIPFWFRWLIDRSNIGALKGYLQVSGSGEKSSENVSRLGRHRLASSFTAEKILFDEYLHHF